jgi:hypothetical protein
MAGDVRWQIARKAQLTTSIGHQGQYFASARRHCLAWGFGQPPKERRKLDEKVLRELTDNQSKYPIDLHRLIDCRTNRTWATLPNSYD